jgi:RNA polymerase sigma factor (TIGR02999 family)
LPARQRNRTAWACSSRPRGLSGLVGRGDGGAVAVAPGGVVAGQGGLGGEGYPIRRPAANGHRLRPPSGGAGLAGAGVMAPASVPRGGARRKERPTDITVITPTRLTPAQRSASDLPAAGPTDAERVIEPMLAAAKAQAEKYRSPVDVLDEMTAPDRGRQRFVLPTRASGRNLPCVNEITQIIDAIGRGDAHASEQLLPMIYQDLRRLAATMLAQEPPSQTLQATALVHEAYVRLVDSEADQEWNHRGHFFAAAAEAMRRILVEKARRKQRVKHGGEHQRVELDDERLVCSVPADRIIALDEALERFAQEEPEKAQLVKLRFFAGLSIEEAAEVLGISRATASRHWTYARAWLHDAVSLD